MARTMIPDTDYESAPRINKQGEDTCTGCMAHNNDALCRALPDTCQTDKVIFVRRGTAVPAAGIKHDSSKPRMDLLDGLWLAEVAKVLTFGAQKYAAHNWRGGLQQSRLIAAALRHITAFNGGEDLDPETGLSHLAHASCCLMFATNMQATRPDMDDRYKAPK